MINEPKYDGDLVTKSYVDRATGALENEVTITQQELETSIGAINKTYGAAPNPPYFVGNLYVDGTNLYRCKTERLIGSFNPADWELATAYPTTEYVDNTYTKPADFAVTGTVDVNGGRITAGSIASVHYVADTTGMKINLDNDTIDSKNFKVNSEGIITATNANLSGTLTSNNVNITGGSLNIGSGNFIVTNAGVITANSISLIGGNITWSGFNKPTKTDLGAWTTWIGPDGIYTGTLTASQVNAVAIDASSIKAGTLSADRISGGSISASSITSNSSINITRNGGNSYLRMGVDTQHPDVSGLRVGSGGVNFGAKGINYAYDSNSNLTGFTYSSAPLLQVDEIHRASNGAFLLKNDYLGAYITLGSNVNIQGGYTAIQSLRVTGTDILNTNGAIGLKAGGTSYCWATSGDNSISGRITTAGGNASSRILKTNFQKFDDAKYAKAYNLLKKINLYDYDYKYNFYSDRRQYGFIIDELEEEEETPYFFRFTEMFADTSDGKFDPTITDNNTVDKDNLPENVLYYKEYDRDVLDKFMLTTMKAMQDKIDTLEEKIYGK